VGIASEHLEHIFDPFFTTKPAGTGLGLAIAYRIIEDHNGTIDVKSEEGKGTAVIIKLPYFDLPAGARQNAR
jgi:signal transduction histidine kinase